MPVSFESSQQRSSLNDVIKASTFERLNYANKNLWSALYGGEIEMLKEDIRQGMVSAEVRTKLTDLQGMVGRQTLSPVVYGLGLLDLQKFLRAEVDEPDVYLDIIKTIRSEWRSSLRAHPAFALENFATDVLTAVRNVAKDQWDLQTARETLAYYYGVIPESCYQTTVNIAKTFFNDFFSERYDEKGVRIFNVLTKRDYREVLQNLHQTFAQAVMQLPRRTVENIKPEEIKTTDTTDTAAKSYLGNAWNSVKTIAQYVIDHPGQVITAGLAAQAVAVAAFNMPRSFNKRAVGDEFRVNTYTNSDQNFPSVAGLSDGNFAVAWQSYGQDGSYEGIYGQLFNSTGECIGSEFQISTYTDANQQYPAIASLTNGNFAVTWQSAGQDGSQFGIYGQVFNSTAGMIGSEFRVNTYTGNRQEYPAIANLNNGGFVVAWQSTDGQDGDAEGIYGQLFNSTAGMIGSEFRVNTYTTDTQAYPAVASLSNGNFVITWYGYGTNGLIYNIYGQVFNSTGGLLGSEFPVNTYISTSHLYPSVIGLSNGNFAVVWQGAYQDGSQYGIYGQLFNSTAGLVGSEFRVNTYTMNDQQIPAITNLGNGNFAVVWQSNGQDGSQFGIYGQVFNSTAGMIGSEFRVNIYTTNNQNYPAVASLSNGNFVVTWNSYLQDGSNYGVYGKILQASLNANNVNQTINYIEDTAYNLADISITTPFFLNTTTVTLSLSNITAGQLTTGTSGSVTSTYNSITGVWRASGVVADVNSLLANVQLVPSLNYNSNFIITSLIDNGFNSLLTGSMNVIGSAVNDAPVNGVPVSQTTNEDTAKVFSLANGNPINVTDIDAGTNPLQVSLTSTNGIMTLGGTTGLTFTIGDGVADSTMTFNGTISNVNTALNGLSFNPSADFNGIASVQIQTNDQGYNGSGGPLIDIDTFNITVNAVNDAPVNGVPVSQTTNEDTAKVFSLANGNPINVTDIDAGTNPLRVTLTATNGAMTLGGTSGLTFTTGNGIADSNMTFTGTASNINTALNGLSFNPTLNFNGVANLQIQTNDQGYSGSGGVRTDTDTVNITFNAVNDAPVNSVPVDQTTNEDTAKVFLNTNGNAITISDDAGTNPLQVTLTSTNGAMTLGDTSGLAFTTGDGTADSTMTFNGTVSNINTALNGLSFNPTANFNGAASLQIQTNDQGYSGIGVPLNDTDTVNITISAVNDAPVNGVPVDQTTNEDTAKVFSLANGNPINVTDIDAGTNPLQVNLTTTDGVLTLAGISGLTFTTGDGLADSGMTFTGTASNINTALNGLSFNPNANFNGAASLQIQTNDQGYSGSGGAKTDTDTVNVTVNPVNDAPILENNYLSISEGQNVTITSSSLSATDIDSSSSSLNFTISGVTHGRFEKITAPGVSLNNFLQQQITDSEIQFVHDGSQLAPTYNVTVSDGSLTTLSTAATIVFDNSVNDPPVLLPASGSVTYTENTPAVVVANNLNVIDVDSANLINATVAITNNFNNAQDVLGFNNQANINGNYDSNSGVLTLAGNATLSEYQTALRSVTYVNSADNPTVGARTISFMVHDGSDLSVAANRTVNITPLNDAPVLDSTTTSTNYIENEVKVINNNIQLTDDNATLASATVTIMNNFDLNEDVLSFVNQGDGIAGNYDSNTGVLTLVGTSSVANYQAALRRVSYQNTSNSPNTLPRTIEFRVNDGSANSNIFINTITITPVNDLPQLGNNQLTLSEGETITLTINNLNATDVDNVASDLQFIPSEVQHGRFEVATNSGIAATSFTLQQINDGAIQFVHDGGELSPSYKISLTDGIAPISAPQAGTAVFTSINDAPVVANPLADQIVTVDEPFSFTVASDTFVDPEQDTLTFTAKTINDEALPQWIQFDEATRKFSGTAASLGQNRFSLFANDTSNAQARMNFTIEAKEKSSNEPKQGWLEQTNNIIGLTTGVFGAVATLVSGGIAGYKWWKRKQQKAEQANLELNEMEQGKSGGVAAMGTYVAIAPNRVSKGHTVIQQRYALINKISREEAKDLLEQTGIEVTFASNENRARFTLGRGQFGKLRLAHDLQTDQFIGVKKIKGKQAIETSQNEGLIQEKLKGSNNVMPLLDSVKTTDSNNNPVLYQFMPLAGWGNGEQLAECLATVKDDTLKMKLLVEATRHFLTGINNMHKARIYHLDIKPNNTVIDKQGNLYVIDFGCAQELMDGQLDGGVGDTRYFSPERLANFRHHIGITGPADEIAPTVNAAKVDAWAVGITLLAWALNRYPFDKNEMKDKIADWDSGYFAYRLNQVAALKKPDANGYFAVIKGLLDTNPETRLTVAEALALPIFQNSLYRFESVEARGEAFADLKQANQVQEEKQSAQPVSREQEEKHYTSGYGSQQSVQGNQTEEKPQVAQSLPKEQEEKHYVRSSNYQQPENNNSYAKKQAFLQPASSSNNVSGNANNNYSSHQKPNLGKLS